MVIVLFSLLPICALKGFALGVYAAQTNASVGITPPLQVAHMVGAYYAFCVNVYDVTNLWSSEFTIVYNASTLQFINVSQQSFFPPSASSFWYKTNELLGFLSVNMSLVDLGAPLSGNGTLVFVCFKVIQKPESGLVSTVALRQVSLLDPSGTMIPCDSVGGVCFWGVIGPDPPGLGMIRAYTDRDGEPYSLGETVMLFAQVTYAGDPVPNKLVAFQVVNAANTTIVLGVGPTNPNGIALMSFRIPDVDSSLGVWTVFSTVEIDEVVYYGVASFHVIPAVAPVGGYSFAITTVAKAANPQASYEVLLASIVLFTELLTTVSMVWRTRRHKRRSTPM